MLNAISRYGVRVLPKTDEIAAACKRRGELVRGPAVAEFEEAFARRVGAGRAIACSYGRMAFYFVLKALQLPAASEVIVPALTFWVIPELARVAGMQVRFADVNPRTFCLDPAAFEAAITDRTRAVVPTHLFGLPCDMDAILAIAERHNLVVIEDCAHALGAEYRGRPVGTLGHASFFSFQTLKPLNTYGGGMAIVGDAQVAARVRDMVDALPWPSEERVSKKLLVGKAQRIFTHPTGFALSTFPILWAASFVGGKPDVYLWEKIRPLDPMPPDYMERYANVQAVLGLAGLSRLDEWTAATQRHARAIAEAVAGVPGIEVPSAPADRTHVYYQYCLYGPDRDAAVRHCIRRGIDIETRHVDVCTELDLFAAERSPAPGASRAGDAIQVPVYASLTDEQVQRIGDVVREALLASSRSAGQPSSRAGGEAALS